MGLSVCVCECLTHVQLLPVQHKLRRTLPLPRPDKKQINRNQHVAVNTHRVESICMCADTHGKWPRGYLLGTSQRPQQEGQEASGDHQHPNQGPAAWAVVSQLPSTLSCLLLHNAVIVVKYIGSRLAPQTPQNTANKSSLHWIYIVLNEVLMIYPCLEVVIVIVVQR